jgi:UDP-N-acetylglucosamine--N-acetylmuramyl-(pentapeptide) pyrophosphoryl-undecaprenol N-acetylglucosamine transferase
VLSTGGYVSVPIGVAARLFRVPYLLHEQTLILGLANRILARLATRVLLSHEPSLKHLPARARERAVVTGNPVRPELFDGVPAAAFSAFGLDPALPLVLVTGGSLGAEQINRAVTQVLPDLLQHCQILHQSGSHGHVEMQGVAAQLPPSLAHRYHLVEFIHDELPDVLAAADIVVARSGAGTVAELMALGKACILIPWMNSAGNEQNITARALAENGAARVLAGADTTPENLRAEVLSLLHDPQRRQALSDAARGYGRPDAAARVVTEMLAVAS